MISLYIIAGWFLFMAGLMFSQNQPDRFHSNLAGLAGSRCALIAAAILAFTEWARATGVF